MVKFVSAERVINELHDRMLEVSMCHVKGDLESIGKYNGLKEAVKIISDLALRLM